MFFICSRIQISDEIWMNFKVYFSSVYRVWISGKGWMNFEAYFSFVFGVWISDERWMNFKVNFSSVFSVWISGKGWMKFEAYLFIYLQGLNFWWIGNVMGTGHPGTGAGWQIPTLEKPVPIAWVYQGLTGLWSANKKKTLPRLCSQLKKEMFIKQEPYSTAWNGHK